jgi:hypothetical protein
MKKSELRQLVREVIKENDPFYKSDSYLDDPKPSDKNDYPHSAPRVYVLMLGNRSRGVMGPYRVYADRAEAEAEAAKQEAEGRDTKAFVQDLAFIK